MVQLQSYDRMMHSTNLGAKQLENKNPFIWTRTQNYS